MRVGAILKRNKQTKKELLEIKKVMAETKCIKMSKIKKWLRK